MDNTSRTEKEYGVKYGESAVFADMDYINSSEYASKFDRITDNAAVNKSLLECARTSIEHRNRTRFEDMYIINANDGTIMGRQLDSSEIDGVDYNDSINTALLKSKNENIPIIAFHNHPLGVPPSVDDFNKAFDNNYYLGVVGGHNGQVYTYSKPAQKVEDPDIIHDDIAYDIEILSYDVDRAHRHYFDEYGLHYKIMRGVEKT